MSAVISEDKLAQARAESAAFGESRLSYGTSFKQGHRRGWRDFAAWAVRAAGEIHYESRVVEMWGRLLGAGIARTGQDIDRAIQSAAEALYADDGVWHNPDSTHGWEVLEPHVLRFLDLTDAEIAAVA